MKKIVFILVLLNVFLTIPAHADITTGLVGWWKMDEGSDITAVDSSGNGNTGTLTNGPIWVGGKKGGAVDFDGTADYIQIANANDLNFGTGDFSIAAWVKADSLDYDYPSIFSAHDEISANAYIFGVTKVTASTGKALIYGSGGNLDSGNTTYNLTQWRHIAVTKSGSTVILYVDGSADGSFSRAGSYSINASYLPRIGHQAKHNSEATSRRWNGIIDDVRVYNRALSAEEVQYLSVAHKARISGGANISGANF